MANQVLVPFIGDPTHLFKTADAVEARMALFARRVSTAATLPMPGRAQDHLTSRELGGIQNLQAQRSKYEKAHTTLYLTQLKTREAAELTSIRLVAATRVAAMTRANVGGGAAASVSTGASAAAAGGVGAGLAAGLLPALGVGAVAAVGLALKESVQVYDELQKKQLTGKAILTDYEKALKNVTDAGKDASQVISVYASRLGRTSESLTESEKRQAIFNESLSLTAQNAGGASLKMTELERSSTAFDKTLKGLLATIGGYTTPAVTNILQFFNELAGGGPALSPAGQADQEAQAWAERQKEVKRRFDQMRNDVARAGANPTGNLFNMSVTRFADKSILLGADRDKADEELQKAIDRGKEWATSYVKGVRTVMENSSVPELRNLGKEVFEMRNVLPFEEWKNLSQDIQKAINEAVEAGKKKVKELANSWRNEFTSLAQQAAGDNPITKIFLESDKALRDLRANLRGMSPELQKVAEDMLMVAKANQLFSARADAAFAAADFRSKAADLRNYKDPLPTEEQFFKALEAFGQKFVKPVYDTVRVGTSNSVMLRQRNPFLVEDRTMMPNGTYGTVRRDIRANMFAAYHQNATRSAFDQHEDLNSPLGSRRFINGGTIRQERGWDDLSDSEKVKFYDMFKQADPASMKAQERLDTSLMVASGLKATNPEQQAELDRKILAIGGSIDPKDLRADQREGLALANERMAVREEQRWKMAQDSRDEHTRLLKKIAGEEGEMKNEAERGGIKAVETRITINDRTNSDTTVETRPSQEDTQRAFANVHYGGSNQGRGY